MCRAAVAERCAHAIQLLAVAIKEVCESTLAVQALGDRAPDPRCCTSDERTRALETTG
jgi:hypothetical protein